MHAPTNHRDRIAQLIFIRFGSNMMPKVEASDDFDRAATLVETEKIGGILLFNGGTSEEAASSLRRLQEAAPCPLTVAADMERGMAQQVTDLIAWPHALAFDALGKSAAAEVEEFARRSALEAHAIGVHVSFSPVADIHRNPRNPIIANRAFGTTAERTVELASAYVRGCHQGGLLCCAKHFPGHGNTHEDSHAMLPVVDEPLATLQATDLLPFRRLIDAQVDMFMTAHVAYPALDATGTPATLSKPILTELLRNEWNFPGAVVSDSLKMDGVKSDGASEGELAVAAIQAGVDLLLDVSDVTGVIDAIERAANEDDEFAKRVEDAFDRAWQIKQRTVVAMMPETLPGVVDAADHALKVARAAVTVLREDQRASLPIPSGRSIGFLLVNPLGDNAYTKTNRIVDLFGSFNAVEKVHSLGPETSDVDAERLLASLSTCDICVVALVVKPSAWQQSALPDWQQELLQALCSTTPTILASLGIAELLDDYPSAATQIVTYSDVPAAQTALTELIMERGTEQIT